MSTNAVIQFQEDDKAEKIDVSRQRLSLCRLVILHHG